MVIPDATKDERFCDNPVVTGPANVRFYAGAPLKTPEGSIVGTFCLVDFEPRPPLTPQQTRRLEAFAQEAVFHMITRIPCRRISV